MKVWVHKMWKDSRLSIYLFHKHTHSFTHSFGSRISVNAVSITVASTQSSPSLPLDMCVENNAIENCGAASGAHTHACIIRSSKMKIESLTRLNFVGFRGFVFFSFSRNQNNIVPCSIEIALAFSRTGKFDKRTNNATT